MNCIKNASRIGLSALVVGVILVSTVCSASHHKGPIRISCYQADDNGTARTIKLVKTNDGYRADFGFIHDIYSDNPVYDLYKFDDLKCTFYKLSEYAFHCKTARGEVLSIEDVVRYEVKPYGKIEVRNLNVFIRNSRGRDIITFPPYAPIMRSRPNNVGCTTVK